MIRRIITIDDKKCDGCGLCATACHEGAIGIVGGKARLLREDYCDGLGDCLPACPTNAISFEMREAPAYDEEAVKQAKKKLVLPATTMENCLDNWPVQLKLAPLRAPYYDGAALLIAADCCAYAYANIHKDFIAGRVTLIGCPKLDAIDYSEKLASIIVENNISNITVLRMVVPCCGGIEYAVKSALKASNKTMPIQVVTIAPDGKIVK